MEEKIKSRISDKELGVQLTALGKKAKLTKFIAIVFGIILMIGYNLGAWLVGTVALIIAVVSIIASLLTSLQAKTLLSDNITRDILMEVFDECNYDAKSRLPDELIIEAALVPNWDEAYGSDLISGKYKGHNIKFSDIVLAEEKEKESDDGAAVTTSNVKFKGQWMVLELGREIPAKLRLRENIERSGTLSKKLFGERFKNKSDVETENEEFNKRFQILTEDPHNAFYILTPHFMEFIIKADDAAKAETNLCFIENRVHIACHTGKDSFELKKNDGSDIDALRTRMKAELYYITSIVDELLKNEYLFGREG